jgi:hypothetical protein
MTDDLAFPGEKGRTLKDRAWQGARYFAFASLFSAAPALLHRDFMMFAGVFVLSAVAGAGGGAIYFATESLRARGGGLRTLANVITLLGFCAAAIALLLLAVLVFG